MANAELTRIDQRSIPDNTQEIRAFMMVWNEFDPARIRSSSTTGSLASTASSSSISARPTALWICCGQRRTSMCSPPPATPTSPISMPCWMPTVPATGRSRSMPTSCSSIRITRSSSCRCSAGISAMSARRPSRASRSTCTRRARSATPSTVRARRCSTPAGISIPRHTRWCGRTSAPISKSMAACASGSSARAPRVSSPCSAACRSFAGMPGMQYLRGTGNVTPVAVANVLGALLRFDFLSDHHARSGGDVAFSNSTNLYADRSVKFENSAQLVELQLMTTTKSLRGLRAPDRRGARRDAGPSGGMIHDIEDAHRQRRALLQVADIGLPHAGLQAPVVFGEQQPHQIV